MSKGQKTIPTRPTVAHAAPTHEGMVSDYPMSSVLVVFSIGIGVGVAVGSLLGGPVRPLPSFAQRTELAAEKLGRQMLDAMAGVLPKSLSKHILD